MLRVGGGMVFYSMLLVTLSRGFFFFYRHLPQRTPLCPLVSPVSLLPEIYWLHLKQSAMRGYIAWRLWSQLSLNSTRAQAATSPLNRAIQPVCMSQWETGSSLAAGWGGPGCHQRQDKYRISCSSQNQSTALQGQHHHGGRSPSPWRSGGMHEAIPQVRWVCPVTHSVCVCVCVCVCLCLPFFSACISENA